MLSSGDIVSVMTGRCRFKTWCFGGYVDVTDSVHDCRKRRDCMEIAPPCTSLASGVAGTIADITATEPSFTVERFEPVGERLEVAGHWRGLRGRRFVRPVLWLHSGDSRRRLVAVLDHKPWAADDGGVWIAAFVWDGGKIVADRAELEVGSEMVVELPLPGARKKAAPAQKRKPSEAELLREQLAAESKERRDLQRALAAAQRDTDALARTRAERDAARAEAEQARQDREREIDAARAAAEEARQDGEREIDAARAEAERAREDGERLVNDEYRQRERAELEPRPDVAAERDNAVAAAERLRADNERLAAERDEAVATRERLVAEREALRADLAAANEDRDRLRAEGAVPAADTEGHEAERAAGQADRERLERELAAGRADRERHEAELAAGRADRERLERELAGAWAEHEHLSAELGAARDGRERVEAELVTARADRKRLERELADHDHRPLRRPAPAAGTASRIAPPRAGAALWTVRAVSLGLVLLLLVAIVLVLMRIA
jgi:hypothetical protein